MGFGFKEILIIAVIVLLVFGTKKLRSLGSDLGTSVKGFKDAMNEEDDEAATEESVAKKENSDDKQA